MHHHAHAQGGLGGVGGRQRTLASFFWSEVMGSVAHIEWPQASHPGLPTH